jgi:hypothetical protein
MVQGRFEFPDLATGHLAIGAQAMYQDNTQVNYFGIGNDAVFADQTQYRLKTSDVVAYATVRPRPWFSFGGSSGWLFSPQVRLTAGTFSPGYPESQVVYPNDPGLNQNYEPDYLHSGVAAMADTLDSHSHPTGGGLYRGAANFFSDRSAGTFSFTQYEAEGLQMVPLVGKHLVLGLHAWTVFSGVPDGRQLPVYLMPSIGGNNTLRGFRSYQFHDQNSLVANAELRLALLTHVDLAGFYDAGNVAARYADLNFQKTSFGAGLRLHTRHSTFARLDVAHGTEGWQVYVRTADPFKFARVTRHVASIPFNP